MGCPSSVILGDNLVFSICTHDPDTWVLTDADSAPAYRIYEDETATPILTGTMAKLDDAGTTGFYTESIVCSAGNGYEVGKTYTIYIEATVDGDKGGIAYAFNVTNIRTTIGVAGAGLTNINLPNQTMDITGNITGNLSGSVGSVTGAVGSVAGNVDGNVSGNVTGTVAGGITPADAAAVNAQVLDVLNVDTFAEPGDEIPTSTTTLVDKISYIYKFLRNKIETTATRIHVYNDAGLNKDH